MKNLTIILIAVLFVSCGNMKAEIVEQIKLYKDSSELVERKIIGLTIDDSKQYEELYYTNGDLDENKLRNKELRTEYIKYQAKNELKQFQFKIKKAEYQGVIDSLELELKKY